MKSDFLARAVPKSLSKQLVAGQNISALRGIEICSWLLVVADKAGPI
jgi:hypothetical protein